MTKISELSIGQSNVDVEGTIKEFGEPRTFNRFGRELTVVNAVLEDDSGNVKLTLWNEDANKFKEGDIIKITNGYVNEFQGEKQLTAGKFGKMEKVGEGEASSKDVEQSELPDEESEESEEKPEDSSEEESEGSEENSKKEKPVDEEEF